MQTNATALSSLPMLSYLQYALCLRRASIRLCGGRMGKLIKNHNHSFVCQQDCFYEEHEFVIIAPVILATWFWSLVAFPSLHGSGPMLHKLHPGLRQDTWVDPVCNVRWWCIRVEAPWPWPQGWCPQPSRTAWKGWIGWRSSGAKFHFVILLCIIFLRYIR